MYHFSFILSRVFLNLFVNFLLTNRFFITFASFVPRSSTSFAPVPVFRQNSFFCDTPIFFSKRGWQILLFILLYMRTAKYIIRGADIYRLRRGCYPRTLLPDMDNAIVGRLRYLQYLFLYRDVYLRYFLFSSRRFFIM